MIMLPWGYDRVLPHNFDDILDLAQKAACKFKTFNYKVGNKVDILYRASGSTQILMIFFTLRLPLKQF